MINLKSNPIEWSVLLFELEDAKEHLENLLIQLNQHGEIDLTDYEIQIGHIYAHLNRSWDSRNKVGDLSEKEHKLFSSFPTDIDTFG